MTALPGETSGDPVARNRERLRLLERRSERIVVPLTVALFGGFALSGLHVPAGSIVALIIFPFFLAATFWKSYFNLRLTPQHQAILHEIMQLPDEIAIPELVRTYRALTRERVPRSVKPLSAHLQDKLHSLDLASIQRMSPDDRTSIYGLYRARDQKLALAAVQCAASTEDLASLPYLKEMCSRQADPFRYSVDRAADQACLRLRRLLPSSPDAMSLVRGSSRKPEESATLLRGAAHSPGRPEEALRPADGPRSE